MQNTRISQKKIIDLKSYNICKIIQNCQVHIILDETKFFYAKSRSQKRSSNSANSFPHHYLIILSTRALLLYYNFNIELVLIQLIVDEKLASPVKVQKFSSTNQSVREIKNTKKSPNYHKKIDETQYMGSKDLHLNETKGLQ